MPEINLLVIFATGLTAGGLSCLAVQAGLLASAVADQAADDLQEVATKPKPLSRHPRGAEFVRQLELLQQRHLSKKQFAHALQSLKQHYPVIHTVEPATEAAEIEPEQKRHPIKPIALFLASRLAAYTILGFGLGWLGSVLQLTPQIRALMLIAVGIFMLGTAGRMLNIHPFFRHFAIEPPKKVRRYLRRKAKNGSDHVFTPLLLGGLTVLVPCGITQVMMATAIASGSPITGALVLFAFILGTSPLFFSVAYGATKLGQRLQRGFLKAVGVVILVLGFIAIEGGLNLAGSPVSFATFKQGVGNFFSNVGTEAPATETSNTSSSPYTNPTPNTSSGSASSSPSQDNGVLQLTASSASYSPSVIKASANKAYKLEITSKGNQGCGRAFNIPSLGKQEILPEDGLTTIDIPPQQPGKMRLTCSMGMYNAVIEFS